MLSRLWLVLKLASLIENCEAIEVACVKAGF